MKPCAILVVDDDPELCDLINRILVRAGHLVACAFDGNEAIKVIAARKFDLVLTDLIMPEKDGIEVIGELRRTQPQVRIVAMSGGGHVAMGQYLKIAKGMGAHAVLHKPFGNDELLATLESVMPKAAPAG